MELLFLLIVNIPRKIVPFNNAKHKSYKSEFHNRFSILRNPKAQPAVALTGPLLPPDPFVANILRIYYSEFSKSRSS